MTNTTDNLYADLDEAILVAKQFKVAQTGEQAKEILEALKAYLQTKQDPESLKLRQSMSLVLNQEDPECLCFEWWFLDSRYCRLGWVVSTVPKDSGWYYAEREGYSGGGVLASAQEEAQRMDLLFSREVPFYGITIGRDHRYATRAEIRKSILRHLRKFSLLPGLETTEERVAVAEKALMNDAWLRFRWGCVASSIARDVLNERQRFLDAIREGFADADAGRVHPHAKVVALFRR